MKATAAVFCEGLHFTYDGEPEPVLRGVDIEIGRGEFVVIAGPSGAGKSTFCRTLNNIIPLFFRGSISGRRCVDGEWLDKQPVAAMSARIGMVFQDFEQQLFSTSSTLELSFVMENFGVSPAEMRERIADLASRFGIAHLLQREPFSLSGGEKQKLAIASVMAYRPRILVMDEPATDLDPDSREFVLQAIPKLKDWVETVILIDHETEQFQHADRIHLLREGVIQAAGEPDSILLNSALLQQNSLSPVDLVVVQETLRKPPSLSSPATLAETLRSVTVHRSETPSRTQSPPVVQAENLSFRYPGNSADALRNVTLEIREGEFAGIIGRNGSGKSTLMKHLNGLQVQQSGSLRVFGKEVREWDRRELARAVGLVFQNPDHQIFESTVRREIEFGPRTFGYPEDEVRRNSDHAIEVMDLAARVDHDPFQLSKGERQRVAVGSVLSVRPRILILDEPTTGLDYRQQRYLMDLLRDLNRAGATIIIVTHALWLVGEYCNYAFALKEGARLAEGHPRDLFFQERVLKLPPLLELSALLGANALTARELTQQLGNL